MRSISISQESRRRTKTTVRWKQIDKITRAVTIGGVIGKSRTRHQDQLFTLSTELTEIACISVSLAERNSVQLLLQSIGMDTVEISTVVEIG